MANKVYMMPNGRRYWFADDKVPNGAVLLEKVQKVEKPEEPSEEKKAKTPVNKAKKPANKAKKAANK